MSLTFDRTEDTTVLIDGEVVLAGVAVQRMRELWGTNWVAVAITSEGYTIANRLGDERITLPIAPPKEQTSSALNNERKRRAAIARAAKERR